MDLGRVKRFLEFITHSQPASSLFATAGQYPASVFGLHPFAESMLVFPLAVVGLICPLHVTSIYLVLFISIDFKAQ